MPATQGQWSALQQLPFRPVHAVVLPTGKVMLYGNGSRNANRPRLWDPKTRALTNSAIFPYEAFCNGHATTADGRVLFSGGQIVGTRGLPKASLFDPVTNTMSPVPDMRFPRFYPSMVTLGSGDIVSISGTDAQGAPTQLSELWEADSNRWRVLTNASRSLPNYPAAFLAPNGKVFVATDPSLYLDTTGNGRWEQVASPRAARRENYGSAAMYDVGKVIITGGATPPLATTEIIDLNDANPTWRFAANMPIRLRQQNITLLPDGTVLVTGGSSSTGFDTNDGPKPAMIWDPQTDRWQRLAVNNTYRGYHSEAVLLADGRVAIIGGDRHPSLEVYSPPYLFNGPRPTVTQAPASVKYGQTFTVRTPDAQSVLANGGQVNWLRPSAVTHTKNMNQRINRLSFRQTPGGLAVTVPTDPNHAPPGDYMLFLVNSDGVPSEAVWIRLREDFQVTGLTEGWQFDLDGRSSSGLNDLVLAPGAAIADDADRGPVLACDGSGGYAEGRNTVSQAFSWAGWVRLDGASSTGTAGWQGDPIVAASTNGTNRDFLLSVLGNRLAFYTGTPARTIRGRTALNDGRWHHVGVSVNGAQTRLFVDGVQDGSGGGVSVRLNGAANLQLCGSTTHGRYLSGAIDDVLQYTRALNAQEMRVLASGDTGTSALTAEQIQPSPVLVGSQTAYQVQTQGGANLQYFWSFGDGSPDLGPLAESQVSHAFAAPGIYQVRVTVRSATGESEVETFQQAVHRPLASGTPRSSSSLIYEARAVADRVWNVNPDNNTVHVYNTVTGQTEAEIPVGASPRALTLGADGLVWVTNKDSATLSLIDPQQLAVVASVPLPPASRPHGILAHPTRGELYLALEGRGELVAIDSASRAIARSLPLGQHLRHLALTADGERLLISRFISPSLPGEATATPQIEVGGVPVGGEVLVVATAGLTYDRTVTLQNSQHPDAGDHHGHGENGHLGARGIPNYLAAPAISPDGASAWIPSKQDNVMRGVLRDGWSLTFDTAVRAVVSEIDLASGVENHDRRVDLDDASVPSAATFGPFGNYLFVASEGGGFVRVIDAYGAQTINEFASGRATQGLVLSADGKRLYAHNFMDRTVSVHDLSRLIEEGSYDVPLLSSYSTVASESLAPQVLRGKQIFYDAFDPRIGRDSYISCASCHNDGDQDGRVWDFTGFGEGLRNTITLRGRAGHGRLHWTANFDEIQDFEGQMRSLGEGLGLMSDADFHGGTTADPLGDPKAGLSADLDALAAYVQTLKGSLPAAERQPDGTLTADAVAGRQLFLDQGCSNCHSGTQLTDSRSGALHDIGTLKVSSGTASGLPILGLDTPSLKALPTTAPYLHDGSAPTIADAIMAHQGVALDALQLGQLSAYLRQLDDREQALPVRLNLLDATVDEDDGVASVPLVLSSPAGFDITVQVSTIAQTAVPGDDFAALSDAAVTVPAGALQGVIDVTLVADAVEEPDETLLLQASVAAGAATFDRSAATLIIRNDDQLGWSLGSATASESAGTVDVPIALDRVPAQAVSASYRSRDGSATAGADYAAVSGSVTIAAGQTAGTVTVPLLDDAVPESTEDFAIILEQPSDGVLLVDTATITIRDEDISACGGPAINLATDRAAFLWQDCASGRWQLRVGAGGVLTTYEGTLRSELGFGHLQGVSLESNDRLDRQDDTLSYRLLVQGVGNDGYEFEVPGGSNTCFTVQLPAGVPLLIGADRTAVTPPVNLADFGPCTADPSRLSAQDVTVAEEAGEAQVTVALEPAAAGLVTVQYSLAAGTALDGADFTGVAGTLSFAPGQGTATVSIPLLDDDLVEGDEQFTLQLAQPDGATLGRAVATIVLRDGEAPSCERPPQDRNGNGDVALWWDCDLSAWTLEFSSAATPSSYTGTVTSSAGFDEVIEEDIEANDVVDLVGDTLSFRLGLRQPYYDALKIRTPQGAQLCVELTSPGGTTVIVDTAGSRVPTPLDPATFGPCAGLPPPVPQLAFTDLAVSEGAAQANILFALSLPATEPVSWRYETVEQGAAAGVDFEAVAGTLTIPAGETSAALAVPLLDDALEELDESFEVRVTDLLGATASADRLRVTITDDDRAPVALPCGPPSPAINRAQERGGFLYRSCDTGSWTLEFAGGGRYTEYTGTIRSDAGFTAVQPLSFEARDRLTETATEVTFALSTSGSYWDGLTFSVGGGAHLCLDLSGPDSTGIWAGPERLPVSGPFDPDTLGSCQDGPARVSALPVTAQEGTASLGIPVEMTRPAEQTVTVDYSVRSDTAELGVDFEAVAGTLSFAPGMVADVVEVPLIDDSLTESAEQFEFLLSNPVNAELGTARTAITIIDDDGVPCGMPSGAIGPTRAAYLWRDCASGQWHFRAAAGGSFQVVRGTLISDVDFVSLEGIDLESADRFDASARALDFEMRVSGRYVDGFNVALPESASVCLAIDWSAEDAVLVGPNALPVAGAFDPRTLEGC